ncbi:MAG: DUF2070 family protein [Candidatus Bathyarchaeia archaeon]
MSNERDASERIVGYYSYLFTFPSRAKMVLAIILVSMLVGIVALASGWGASDSPWALAYNFIALAMPLLLSDAVILPLFKGEILLNPRRFTIMTYVSAMVYTAVILISSLFYLSTGLPDIVLRGFMLSVAVNACLRYLNIRVFLPALAPRNLAVAFTQPALCFASAWILLPKNARILGFGVLSTLIMVGGVQLLLAVLARWKGAPPGLELTPLFRAFVLSWTEGLNGPLEEQITRMGETRDLSVDSLVFGDAEEYIAAFVVPYIHPGPFRDVGSSGLPGILVNRIGKELDCPTLVAHGISTHERDLTRSDDNSRVAEAVASNLLHPNAMHMASPMVWAERDSAMASCQLFGEAALITLSLSPKSYDDLPEDLCDRIMGASRGVGLAAIVVDSHHSIRLDCGLEDYDPKDLYQAAIEALERAREMPRFPFAVGAARVIPDEWGLEEGMGPSGIAALSVCLTNGQTSTYIVIDGNNMVSGLREKIVDAMRSMGVDEVEVMTSDTHLVNAIGKTTKGYFPLGEKTDQRKLIDYVVEAVKGANSRLRRSSARHARTVVPGLTVLGSEGLDTLSRVLDSGFDVFKTAGLIIMPTSFILAVAILTIL